MKAIEIQPTYLFALYLYSQFEIISIIYECYIFRTYIYVYLPTYLPLLFFKLSYVQTIQHGTRVLPLTRTQSLKYKVRNNILFINAKSWYEFYWKIFIFFLLSACIHLRSSSSSSSPSSSGWCSFSWSSYNIQGIFSAFPMYIMLHSEDIELLKEHKERLNLWNHLILMFKLNFFLHVLDINMQYMWTNNIQWRSCRSNEMWTLKRRWVLPYLF